MKLLDAVIRLFVYASATLLALFAAFWVYVNVPRTLGEVIVQRVSLAPLSKVESLDDLTLSTHPRTWLRVEISSQLDLVDREVAVGGTGDLYIENNCCDINDPIAINGAARGPFPDDLPANLPIHEIPIPGGGAEVYGGERRHAAKKVDGHFHYAIYIAADELKHIGHRDLHLRISGSSMLAPHAESRIITISNVQILQAIKLGIVNF